MPDLKATTLYLQPIDLSDPAPPAPRWWGRAAHALWLDVVAAADPALAEAMHAGSVLRPFTLSTLMGRFPQGALSASEVYRLRITTLSAAMSALLEKATTEGALAVGQVISLDFMPFRVQDVAVADDAWNGFDDYTHLAATFLGRGKLPQRRIRMVFSSPTHFRSRDRLMPVPLPELTFGSLLKRWNAFAPVAFPDEARTYAETSLAIARYDLHTRLVAMKNQGKRPGAVGSISYSSIHYDRYWMGVMQTLAAFARFAGVGAGVTQGLGQCRAETSFHQQGD